MFAVIDPIGSQPVFVEATRDFDDYHKKKIAHRASGIAFIILLFFIVIGQLILEGIDVTLDAFLISGGVILFLFALTMIFGDGKSENEKNRITDYKPVTIFPVAIPFIASPDAIMDVVIMADNHKFVINEQVLTAILVLVVIGLTSLILLATTRVQRSIGSYGITVISKIMGLILVSYAV